MRRVIGPLLLAGLSAIPGCGGGGDEGGSSTPQLTGPAAALDSALRSNLVKVMPMAANIQSSLIFMLNPGSALAPGVQLAPDTSPNAPPHSFVVSGDFDGNQDGLRETSLSGTVVFATDPAVGWSSLAGQMTVAVNVPLIGHVYQATINYTLDSDQATLWGSGSFANPVTGITMTLGVPVGAPLVIKPATGDAGAIANACGHSIAGAADIQAANADGTLATTASFSHDSASVSFHGSAFTDSSGSTALPDSTADLNCGGANGTLGDWVATFDVAWSCLPQESGSFRTTLAVGGATALAVTDEGDTTSYTAAMVGTSPHAVRGFFIAGQAPNTYREDFTWTLRKDGHFSQFSVYRWQQGSAFFGTGGVCAATGTRL